MALDPNVIGSNLFNLLFEVGAFVLVVIVGLLLGYIIGWLVSFVISRILSIKELKEQIASSEILSLALWGKVISGTAVYIKWLFVSIGLKAIVEWASKSLAGNTAMYGILTGYADTFQVLMINLGMILVFGVLGIVIGAVIYRMIKAVSDSLRVEERMIKHGLHDALGGMQLTKVIAGIFMIYVVLVLLGSGIDSVAVRSGPEFSEVRLVVMFRALVALYPEFVLGALIIIAGALLGDFLQDRITESKAPVASGGIAWVVQALVIFFAIVLALPHFQIKENVDILTDSFKIIVAGISIGLAIAMGLGFKDLFSQWGKKIEKNL